MHLGEIHQTGTPAELREQLGMKRLEVRTDNLGEAEDKLMARVADGSESPIADVQRFGDRLDVLVRDPDTGRKAIEDELSKAALPVRNISATQPTLENAFVATLRGMGQESRSPAFPGRHSHRDLRDGVAIGAKDLSKQFGSFQAVKNVNLQIKYGEIYGLLGANGAGKTTTIKMLCGLLASSSGGMELAGEKSSLRSERVRERIGYMSQKFSLYDDLTIEENLEFFAGVYAVPPEELVAKKSWVLEFAGLKGKERQMTASLPGGWKQRVAFGAAILHEPSVLFLDEPTSGVDPLARRAFWRMINRLADRGTAILVTTHYLEEAEQCNRLGFMVAGELVAEGTPSGVKSQQGGHLLELTVNQPQRAADLLKQKTERWRVSLFGDRLHVIVDEDVEEGKRTIAQKLQSAGIEIHDVREENYSLEDVFIVVVEKAKRQGKTVGEE
jgi:ABC-2 type transport system ATP-binding protein